MNDAPAVLTKRPASALRVRPAVWRRRAKEGLKYVVATVGVLIAITPYLYMVVQSLAPWSEVDRRLIPSELTLRSYEWLLQGSRTVAPKPWFRALLNSALVDRKSTRLNSSHVKNSYAVFCFIKKKKLYCII